MKKKIFLVLTALILSTTEGKASVRHEPLMSKNPLEACHNCDNWIENKLIELLDQTIEAKRYWLTVGDRPWYRVATRPIRHWFSFSWQTEIKEHLSHLEDLQNVLAIKLGKNIAYESEEDSELREDIYTLIIEANSTLKIHGTPSHAARNWFFYIGAAVAAYKVYQAGQNYLNSHVNFVFDESQRPHIIRALQDSQCNHSLTVDDSKIYVSSSTEPDKEGRIPAEEFEERVAKYVTHHTPVPTNIYDFKRSFLDEKGQFLGKTFVYTCLVNPVKAIWAKLKEDGNTKKTTYTEDEKKLNQLKVRESSIDLLNYAATTKNKEGNLLYPEIAAEVDRQGSLSKLSDESLKNLIHDLPIPLGEYLQSLGAEKLKEFLKNLSPETDKMAYVGSYVTAGVKALENALKDKDLENTLEYKWIQYALAVFKSTAPQVLNNTSTFLNALEFLTESAKTTPFLLALYVSGRGIKGVHQWRRNHYFTEPLRYDLKDFINFLDENLHTHVNNQAYKGLHYYWTLRLKRYRSFMDSKNRIYFEKDLQKLTRGATITHEIETLKALLYHELNHF